MLMSQAPHWQQLVLQVIDLHTQPEEHLGTQVARAAVFLAGGAGAICACAGSSAVADFSLEAVTVVHF